MIKFHQDNSSMTASWNGANNSAHQTSLFCAFLLLFISPSSCCFKLNSLSFYFMLFFLFSKTFLVCFKHLLCKRVTKACDKMKLTEKFFGCCDLQYSAIVLGSLSAFLSFLAILEITPLLTNYYEVIEEVKLEEFDLGIDFIRYKDLLQGLISLILIFAVFYLIFSILMIVGAAKV